jgi:predicted dithiol-disulfide oxidoreductase (DUF899 family)
MNCQPATLAVLANESEAYLGKRDELRLAEIELMRQRERVAELRRQLPQGAPVQDYEFTEGPANLEEGDTPVRPVRLSELFTAPHHLAQNVDVVIVAAADPAALRADGRTRDWDNLRLLSCGANTFKYDLRSEDREGYQDSTVSVFTKESDGTLRHSYTAHPSMAENIKERGLDLLFPVYNVLDLTPRGRGNWYASFDYPANLRASRS